MIYLDFAAAAPMKKSALLAYQETAAAYFGNPNSPHLAGQQAEAVLTHCRRQLGQELRLPAESLVFTSGGTEANRLALHLSLKKLPPERNEILVSPLEHAGLRHELAALCGYTVKSLPLEHGLVTKQNFTNCLSKKTGLVLLQQVNSSTGILQTIEPLAQLAAENGSLFHCDCVQSFGKLPLPKSVTSWSCSGHKFGGPKSCGLLYLAPQVGFTPLVPGIAQEQGFRAGTVDLPGIVSFTAAACDTFSNQAAFQHTAQKLQHFLWEALPQWDNFSGYPTAPGIIGLFSPKELGATIVETLSEKGICLSTTSACNTQGRLDPSLLQLGFSPEKAARFIRISIGEETTLTELSRLTAELRAFT